MAHAKPPKHPIARAPIAEGGIGFGTQQFPKPLPLAESIAQRKERARNMQAFDKHITERARRYRNELARRTRKLGVIQEYKRRHSAPSLSANFTKEEYDELYTGGRNRKTRRRSRLTKKRRV